MTTSLSQEEKDWPSTCNKAKESYEECFFHWYRESFLKGVSENPCEDLWKAYESCVKSLASSRKLEHLLTSEWNLDQSKGE
ncbi:hypothetical protein Gasu2_04110 [Galdieria sulphuraria]|uniref:Phosphatidylinositol N-acetylglucosaminyltransferase n=1 Tax=Galdieria sulphuraria TaxID=130081 RepID=M2Y118_GALSU|nr:phosphatidylinositol N-acetylglucosaminyltransferase [Galdieria sulphuraria]EME29509.1 phosphatidylinositol N-acetylglucosaminyltransferase [Galdieria sulphuraria]GJD05969.1 hypothetical protein Gasu2_04110 [Galdieria sulphuraria]|eukprot:XP_005706029.1 phosphatidylinositol N-acetylglucosaminyltransferase [Galdieria sulphuraria]